MYNADHISTYRFSFSPDSIHLFSCCASTLCLFSTASIRLGTTLCKLCCYTNSSSSPCLIYFHDAFPHYFHWFHPNSRCVCKNCLTFFFSRMGPVCKAISRCYFVPLPAVLSQLLPLFCSIRLLPKTCTSGSLLCCSLRALSGPVSHKDQLPLSILTDFGLLECLHGAGLLFYFANAEAWVHWHAFCHRFPPADWMSRCYFLWEIIIVERYGTGHELGFCVCVGGIEFH